MRNSIVVFTILILFNLKAFGQQSPVIVQLPKRNFDKEKMTLDQVSGHWIASFEEKTYDLTLKSSVLTMAEQTYPVVIGSLEVKEGGKTIYTKEMDESDVIKSFLMGSASDNAEKIHGIIRDESINKKGNIRLTLNKDRTELNWEILNYREWAIEPELFDFPIKLTFNKK